MRLTLAATAILAASLTGPLATRDAAAQGSPQASDQVSGTGRRMPQPGAAAAPAGASSGTATPAASPTEAQQREGALKAQRASEARDKAWDAKLRRTMSTICNGC